MSDGYQSPFNPQPQNIPQQPAPQSAVPGMPPIATAITTLEVVGERRREVVRLAHQLYERNPDWVSFYRDILGVGGIARRYFTSGELMDQFEHSEEYQQIQQMVAKLRERGRGRSDGDEPTRVITVRLPDSLHQTLRTEAHEKRTSMNKLCISKLLQMIDGELIPND